MYLQFDMGDQSRQQAFAALQTRQTPALPLTITIMGEFFCDSRYYTIRQDLEECLILYTLEGQGIIEYEGTTSILAPGQLMVLDCRKYHYYATQGDHWHFLWLHLGGKCAFDFVALLNARNEGPIHLDHRISFKHYHEKFTYWVTHFDLHRELEISAALQNLFTELINLKHSEEFSMKYGRYQPELEESISYLQDNYRENISVDQLAQDAHLSKYYYIKIFKAYTGQTPYDYLLSVRLQQAQKLLLDSESPVSAIARETGFSDSRIFISCFKKKVGITPLQFRRTRKNY